MRNAIAHSSTFPSILGGILFLAGGAFPLSMTVPFGSHMVVQRGMSVPIWGTGTSGEAVLVTFDGQSKSTTVGSDGKWRLSLDAMVAGGPYTLTAKGASTVTFTDVMVGEVWQCAGQSNMDTRMGYSEYPSLADSIKAANFPKLRYLTMRQPGQTIQWQQVSPATVGALSATGYFFGREMLDHLDGVAVGLLVTAVGGTTIAQWMDPTTIASDASLQADPIAGNQYDSWVKPVVGYAIAGTAWYQGEQDCSSALYKFYTPRLLAMAKAWRRNWGQGNFPFLISQLAHAHAKQTVAGGSSNYGEIRESQRIAADSIPNAFLEVNIDLGSTPTLHYDQKPIVGHRLGLLARGGVYKETGLSDWRSPEPSGAWVSGGTVKVLVSHAGAGLATSDGAAPAGFAIAGSDGNWVWATASIRGDTILVQNPSVTRPTQVRYAFADFPVDNVVGGSKLPLTPFRFAGLPSIPPVAVVRGGTPVAAGWTLRGRRLVVSELSGSLEPGLEILSPQGGILSRPGGSPRSDGTVEWNLEGGSGVRLFRVRSGDRTIAQGRLVLP